MVEWSIEINTTSIPELAATIQYLNGTGSDIGYIEGDTVDSRLLIDDIE